MADNLVEFEPDIHHIPEYMQWRAIEFVADVLKTLHLNYMVTLVPEVSPEDSGAQITVKYPYRVADLQLGDNFMELAEHQQIRILLHEAFHIMHVGHDRVFDAIRASGCLSDNIWEMVLDMRRAANEDMADAMALLFMDCWDITEKWDQLRRKHPSPEEERARRKETRTRKVTPPKSPKTGVKK